MFKTSAVEDQVELTPIDTGIWEGSCNASHTSGPHLNLDCHTPLPPVGTLGHLDHLLLAGLRLWASRGPGPLPNTTVVEQANRLLSRSPLSATSYDALPVLKEWEAEGYWEANILGNPQYPQAVRFVLPLFGALFGTPSGQLVRRFADKHRWPVVWALGDASDGSRAHASAQASAGNNRLLDPIANATARLNVSLPADSAAVFERVWAEAARERLSGKQPPPALVRAWWAQLEPATRRLGPVSATSCSDWDSCIGVVVGDADDCVCASPL